MNQPLFDSYSNNERLVVIQLMIFGFWTVSQTKTSHLKTTVWAFYWMVFKPKKKKPHQRFYDNEPSDELQS